MSTVNQGGGGGGGGGGSETHSYEVSNSRWWNPFSWGSTRTEYTTVTYTYANVHEAVEKIEEYVISSKAALINSIKEIINIRKFRIDITESIQSMFDFGDAEFDPDDILIPVENAVNRITIPTVEINIEKHIEVIRNQFKSSEVRDDEIQTLRSEQARVVALVTNDLKIEVGNLLKSITNRLENIKSEFIPSLTNDLETTVNEIRKQIKNREEYLTKYDNLLKIIED